MLYQESESLRISITEEILVVKSKRQRNFICAPKEKHNKKTFQTKVYLSSTFGKWKTLNKFFLRPDTLHF